MEHVFLHLVTERVATTFELLPERVDLLSFVVEMAAATTIFGSAIILLGGQNAGRQPGSVSRPQRFAILGAVVAVGIFLALYIAHKVG
jgi:hypothetical protein